MFNYRDIILGEYQELTDSLPYEFTLRFDNGEQLSVKRNPTIFGAIFLNRLVKNFPNLLIDSFLHPESITKHGESVTNKLHISLLERAFKRILEAYGLFTPESRTELLRTVNDANTDAYNALLNIGVEYVESIDITDLTSITNHPYMVYEVYNNLYPSVISIENAYDKTEKFLKTHEDMKQNNAASIFRAGAINSSQLFQVLVCRGYCLDITNDILTKPVLANFTTGIKCLADSISESRSAALALSNTSTPLEKVEYTSRTIQLHSSILESIQYVDCGSTKYLDWIVKKSDLKNMVGIYYLDENTNSLKTINVYDFHLVDKSIKIRSPIAGCDQPDGVCTVCAGALTQNKPPHSNAGIYFASILFMEISQKVLSTKHLLVTAKSEKLTILGSYNDYITLDESGRGYKFHQKLEQHECEFLFEIAEAESLNDIIIAKEVEDLQLSRISGITTIGIRIGKDIIEIPLNSTNTKALLSYEMLEYIKNKGHKVEGKLYVVELSNWDFDETFSIVPDVSYSMLAHSILIANLLEGKVSETKKRSETNPGTLLVELFDLCNSKLTVNLTTIQLLLYAVMITDLEDFSLPKGGKGILSTVDRNISRRSIGTALAYEKVYELITNVNSHRLEGSKPKPDSPFDIYL